MSSTPQIAIVGGGLAALVLGRVLQLKSIPFTIFESEESENRRQGGTLDLDKENGQAALHIAQLHDEFRKYMRLEGQAMRITNKHGEVLLDHVPDSEDDSRPEIDRGQLRQIFLDVLGDSVKWNSRVKSVSRLDSSGYQVNFTDGSTRNFDYVVGADGCFSVVRPLLTSVRPGYTGIFFNEMYINDADNKYPEEAATTGDGSLFALQDGRGLVAQRNSGGVIRIYAVISVPEFWAKQVAEEYDWSNPTGVARQKLLDEFFPDWSPKLRNLISNSLGESPVSPRPIHYMPIDHKWDHASGATLIGDAAHVMSPYAGAGANLAMLDGARLGEAIAEGLAKGDEKGFEESIKAFEEEMFARTSSYAQFSDFNLRTSLSSNGAERMMKNMKAIMQAGHESFPPKDPSSQ